MPKFTFLFTETRVRSQEHTVTAKDEDEAHDKAHALVDEGKLKEKDWSDEEIETEIEFA